MIVRKNYDYLTFNPDHNALEFEPSTAIRLANKDEVRLLRIDWAYLLIMLILTPIAFLALVIGASLDIPLLVICGGVGLLVLMFAFVAYKTFFASWLEQKIDEVADWADHDADHREATKEAVRECIEWRKAHPFETALRAEIANTFSSAEEEEEVSEVYEDIMAIINEQKK